MNITTFMATLLPQFSKSTLVEELDNVSNEVNRINMPILEAANKEFGKEKFQTDIAKDMEEALRGIGLTRQPNFIGYFLDITKHMRDILPKIETWIEKEFDHDISSNAITPVKYNLLQYVPMLTFICRYVRMFYNMAITIEINTRSDSEFPVFDILGYHRDWLARNADAFINSVKILMKRSGNLDKVFESLPDMNIDTHNAKLIETTQGKNVDPLEFGLIPLSINPIFHFRKIIVAYQASRYHSAKEEKRMLEQKTYNLKLILDGRNDPRLQKRIIYDENRVRELQQQIDKWEKEYLND